MRILVYNWRDLAHPRAGGAEVFTQMVARHWVEWGHSVTLFTSSVAGSPRVEEVDGVEIVRRGDRVGVYREARRFYEKEAANRFDVVLDGINTRPFLCPRFVHDAPVVALIHQLAREVWFYEVPLPLALVGRFFLEPRWLRLYRDVPVLTVSESTRSSLLPYGVSDVAVVPIGASGPGEPPTVPREERPTLIFVGRLSRNKRPHHAIRAFRIAAETLPDLQLWVVGTGPLERRLRKQECDGVQFFGRVRDQEKLELMARAHAVVATSVREGWGLTVSEAAAVGTKAIAYDVAGLRDSVAASSGFLVRRSPRAMARGIVSEMPRLMASPVREPSSGGTVPWEETSARILDHLQRHALSRR